MATPVTLGTAKTDWQVPLDSSAAALTTEAVLEDPGTNAGFLSEVPSVDIPNGRFVLTMPTAAGDDQVSSSVQLGFFGEGAASKVLKARIWAISKTSDDEVETAGAWGIYLGELEIILGAKFYTGTGGAAPFSASGKTYRFADTINIVEDYSSTPPGMRLVGAGTGAFATLLLDGLGATAIVVSLVIDDATSAGLTWRVL